MTSPEPKDLARTQALCWLLDELFDAEDDLLELMARPGALVGWRRERLGVFCERVGKKALRTGYELIFSWGCLASSKSTRSV